MQSSPCRKLAFPTQERERDLPREMEREGGVSEREHELSVERESEGRRSASEGERETYVVHSLS